MNEKPAASNGGSKRGIGAEEMRRHNLSAVLEQLHLRGPTSRSRLSAETGLNRSTIRGLLSELGELGLVVEGEGTTSGSRGRPSTVAAVRPQGAVVLAAEIEVDSSAVALIGLGGEIFEKVRIDNTPGASSPDEMVDGLSRLAAPIIKALPPERHLVGVGVAVAGVVRREDGLVQVSPNLGWENVPLGEMIANQLDIDHVMMANEADIGAFAELKRGAGRRARHMIFVAGAVGVGIGIIHDGQPMLGTSGYAGEAGHNVINPDGRECRCGSIGCWETEVGELALARLAGIEVEGRQQLINEALRRTHSGDPQMFETFAEIGKWLGIGIGNLINTFNPDLVVIGGLFHPFYPFLEQQLVESARDTALAAPWDACTIRRSELGEDARLVGAAELVFAEMISDPTSIK